MDGSQDPKSSSGFARCTPIDASAGTAARDHARPRSALAFTLAGTRDCDEIHALYASPGADARRQILDGFYFNAWRRRRGIIGPAPIAASEIDVGEATNPTSIAHSTTCRRMPWKWRGSRSLNGGLRHAAPRADVSGTSSRRLGDDSSASDASAPRICGDAAPETVLRATRRKLEGDAAVSNGRQFWRLVTGVTEPGIYLDDLITAINRGEGLSDPKRLGNALALRVRVVERGTVSKLSPLPRREASSLSLPATTGNDFVEHIPQALRLVYAGADRAARPSC